MKFPDLFIDGRWTPSSGAGAIQVDDATTESVIGSVPEGGPEDIARAAEAASRAHLAWAREPVTNRADALRAIADAIEQHRDDFVDVIIAEVGTPRPEAEVMQVGMAVQTFRQSAELAGLCAEVREIGNSRVHLRPAGVVGCITPWNYPLYLLALKMAPAVVTGCTVVIKPSEIAPLSVFMLADLLSSLDLPPGVVNVVSGTSAAGAALVENPRVAMISFTGSDVTGRKVAEMAGRSGKRIILELGGKNPNVVLDDGDLEAAIEYGLRSGFSNNGQTCAALTRFVVPRKRLREAEALAAEGARLYECADPKDPSTRLGPLATATQRDRVLDNVNEARRAGARLVVDPQDHTVPRPGYFVPPTVFSDVSVSARIAQEEVFGPVIVIHGHSGDEDAVEIANATRYGLSAAIWSRDEERASAVAVRLDASTVYVNGGAFNAMAPFGGFKSSGYGRERGEYGLREFLQTRSLQY